MLIIFKIYSSIHFCLVLCLYLEFIQLILTLSEKFMLIIFEI